MEFCKVACVLAGGGIGSVARFFIASEIQRLFPAYPWGTLCVNLAVPANVVRLFYHRDTLGFLLFF